MLNFRNNEYMKAFGMEVANEMTSVPARVLHAPQVLYKNNVSVAPQFGGWQVRMKDKMTMACLSVIMVGLTIVSVTLVDEPLSKDG
jgi:hypothetical protein